MEPVEPKINNEESEFKFSIPPKVEKAVTGAWIVRVGTAEEAQKIATKFWESLGDEDILRFLKDGSIDVSKHNTITSGARTVIMQNFNEPEYKYSVIINQNGSKLPEKTEEAIRKILSDLGI